MNQVLSFTWKEWRAQRGLLIAYTGMVFACLCLGLYLAPRHMFDEGHGVHALTWFVAAGVIGVVAFVVPALVRGEFVDQKGDQFVRRLPGTLWPAFWGKLVFLVLAMLLLPLLGLLCGELFVTAIGQNWDGLFTWDWRNEVWLKVSDLVPLLAAGLLLVPWIWATGTWTPGGRLALLATVLLGLVIGVSVFAVVRQSPGLLNRFDWQRWLWYVPLTGLVAVALSWGLGRRGGGPLRSARWGLLATAVAIVPWGGWLAERAFRYHWPRTDQLAELDVFGITPDGRFALASASERQQWMPVRVRIDLERGGAQQVGGVQSAFTCEVGLRRPGWRSTQRWWRTWDDDHNGLYDLLTNEASSVGYDWRTRQFSGLGDDVRTALREQQRANAYLSAPGGVPVWLEGNELCFGQEGGIERVPFEDESRGWLLPSGHALMAYRGNERRWFDLVSRAWVPDAPRAKNLVQVGSDRLLLQSVTKAGERGGWMIQRGDRPARACDALSSAKVLGLLDDEWVLAQVQGARDGRLFAYRPSSGDVVFVVVPSDTDPRGGWRVIAPMQRMGSLLPRDPRGRVWLLRTNDAHNDLIAVARGVDGAVSVEPLDVLAGRVDGRRQRLLRWDDYPKVLLQQGADIVEVDVETGEHAVRFDGDAGR